MTLPRRRFLRAVMLGSAGLLAGWQPLMAAGQTRYTVLKGDTLSEIAARFGTSVHSLKASNNLRSDIIRPGQKLIVPATGASRTTAGLTPAVIAAIDSIRVARGRWQIIVGHHSGIEFGNAKIYDRNHRERGMEHGLAYHFVIGNGRDSGEGEIEIGPRWNHQWAGGHVRDPHVNQIGIGICVVGNFQKRRPSAKQMASFTALVDHLDREVISNRWKFMVHREVDHAHTVCPGNHFPIRRMHARYDRAATA